MQQSIPCETARQLDVVLRQDVILATATALCNGNNDCTLPNSEGHLPNQTKEETKMRIIEKSSKHM